MKPKKKTKKIDFWRDYQKLSDVVKHPKNEAIHYGSVQRYLMLFKSRWKHLFYDEDGYPTIYNRAFEQLDMYKFWR